MFSSRNPVLISEFQSGALLKSEADIHALNCRAGSTFSEIVKNRRNQNSLFIAGDVNQHIVPTRHRIGCKEGIPVYLDDSLKRFTTVFPAVGSPSSAIELNLDELFTYSKALEWIDVCKLPE